MAEDVGTPELDQPIRLLATDCNELFQEVLQGRVEDPDEVVSLADECHEAFTAWASFVCVFEASDSCLDYRLRKHPSVQDVIFRLLEILRQNLYLLSCDFSENPQESQHDEIPMALAGIQGSMMSLNKIALAIRQSSRSSAITLARNFATMNRALVDLEDLVLIALETLYPNTPESLRKQLCDTMTDRYAKIEYNAYRRGKSHARPLKRLQREEAATERRDRVQAPESSPDVHGARLEDYQDRQGDMQAVGQATQQKPLSSIDTGLLRQTLGKEYNPGPQSRRTLSAYQTDSRLHEPPPPLFEDGETHTECEWCYESIDRSFLRDKGWSDVGRRHYKRDLKPFPCLSEACGESRPSFPSRAEWLKHMRSSHSTVWSQELHRQRMWVCNDHVEPEGGTTYAFSLKSDLERHMLLLHPSNTSLSDDNLAESAGEPLSFDETPPLDLCPLCLFVEKSTMDPEEDKDTKIEALPLADNQRASIDLDPGENNKESLEKKETRVTFAEDVRPASDDSGPPSSDNNPSTPFSLELHVAAHLQYLMVLSLRIVATLDYDSDQDTDNGGSGFSDSATGSISLVEEGIGLEAWPEEESTVPYLSDSEMRHLAQTRPEEGAENTIPPSEVEENWSRVRSGPEKSDREDPVLQHLSSRHGESFHMDSLTRTIEELRLAVEKQPEGHPSRAELWWNIGTLLGEQFEITQRLTDLNNAIEAFKEATNLAQTRELRYLDSLCIQLTNKYTVTGQTEVLEEAITAGREALTWPPYDGPDQAAHHANLGFLLGRRYLNTGDVRDLDIAIISSRNAISLAKKGDPGQARYHNSLGLQLTLMYWRTGSQSVSGEAIQVMREALYLALPSDTERGGYLATLSVGLSKRFATSESPEDLEEAIRLMRDAADLVPQSRPDYLTYLNSLGAMLGESYKRTGAADVLHEAIRIGRNVVSLTPRDHPDAAEHMENLAARLSDRYQLTGSPTDLDAAIELTLNENGLVQKEHPTWFIYQHSVAVRLGLRYSLARDIKDLEQAALCSRQAIDAIPDDHINRATCLNTLAFTLGEMYSATGSLESLEEALELYDIALDDSYSPVLDRIHAGQQLLRRAAQLSKWPQAYKASQKTVSILRELPFGLLQDSDKERILDESAGIVRDGVAAAANATVDPSDILRLLEDGRSLLANYVQDMTADVEALSRLDGPAAKELVRLRAELGRPMSAPLLAGDSPWKAQSQKRHSASKDLEKLASTIQHQLRFDGFWLPLSRERIVAATRRGPIIVLNASLIRCDALIFQRYQAQLLNLPDLHYEDILKRLDSNSLSTSDTLSWLWDTIASPVLAALGFVSAPPGTCPRIWWIPTGPLTNFPIHAAGHHRSSSSESVLSRVVSSYSPSVRALLSYRERAIPPTKSGEAAFVAIKDGRGFAPLAFVPKELAALHPLWSSLRLDPVELRKGDDVLSALSRCKLFHLAGSFAEMENPLKSDLVLGEDFLTVADLLKIDLRASSPVLAYLSSCDTARTKNKAYADEGVHLAGAFRIAGFRHAIGTLGAVSDRLCLDMARLTYEKLRGGGMSDESIALALHNATRKLRDRWSSARGRGRRIGSQTDDSDDNRPPEWAAFAHFGV